MSTKNLILEKLYYISKLAFLRLLLFTFTLFYITITNISLKILDYINLLEILKNKSFILESQFKRLHSSIPKFINVHFKGYRINSLSVFITQKITLTIQSKTDKNARF